MENSGIEGQKDRGTERQRDRGTELGTEGQRDRGSNYTIMKHANDQVIGKEKFHRSGVEQGS